MSNKILLVDDEPHILRSLQFKLERVGGYEIITAADGQEAVDVFRAHADEIDCVLLDLTMPHLDGEDAFRELRRIRPGVTVILCSGYNEQDATHRFGGDGLAGFIQKPYEVETFSDTLEAVLKARRAKPKEE